MGTGEKVFTFSGIYENPAVSPGIYMLVLIHQCPFIRMFGSVWETRRRQDFEINLSVHFLA
jgi:hypothetical protein